MERRKQEHMVRHATKRRKMQMWNDAQEKYLIAIMEVDNASYTKAADSMEKEFGIRRTPDACERKHSELRNGVIRRKTKEKKPSHHNRSWKAKHEAFVLNNFRVLPTNEIAKKLGRTEDAVRDRFNFLMRLKGTSVVVGEKNTQDANADFDEPILSSKKKIVYPEYIPKRWIIREIKSQYRTKIRQERAKAKQQINDLRKEMKEEIRRIKNDE